MSSSYLGIKGLNVSDDTGVAATYAVDAIADASPEGIRPAFITRCCSEQT